MTPASSSPIHSVLPVSGVLGPPGTRLIQRPLSREGGTLCPGVKGTDITFGPQAVAKQQELPLVTRPDIVNTGPTILKINAFLHPAQPLDNTPTVTHSTSMWSPALACIPLGTGKSPPDGSPAPLLDSPSC